ncbi:MAG: GAF domain-containing protein, partial [Firmicutes bacterium]|nr:GAF domain-containing protein [Bacillota bacterium]
MTKEERTARVLESCLALSAERDREALLSAILDTAMDVACCDAGTLYLLEEGGLRFCRMVTRSKGVRQGGHASPITLPPVPLEESYVAAFVALHGETINVADVRTETRFDFTGSLRYDAMTGYRTKSQLVIPMADDRGELIGVMQLINALDENGETIAFSPELELPVRAIASQAAISITNMRYAEQTNRLLDSLVGALSTAIDERTPYNADHTRNMARMGARFLDWLEETGNPWVFSQEKRRTFLLAVLLHDVGKLVVPLEVMDKATRLGNVRLERIRERFRRIVLTGRIAFLEGVMSPEEYGALTADVEHATELVERVNGAGFLPDDLFAEVEALAARTFVNEAGEPEPWLTGDEYTCLSVRKGTLTAEERSVMEGHVVMTDHILSRVTFPKQYADVPVWAAAHHEYLSGRGYPNHLTADAIPAEVRLLTILDVFDALTARNRPYKPAMPVEKALAILTDMADHGDIDRAILQL